MEITKGKGYLPCLLLTWAFFFSFAVVKLFGNRFDLIKY